MRNPTTTLLAGCGPQSKIASPFDDAQVIAAAFALHLPGDISEIIR